MLKGACECLLTGAIDKKMKDDLGERSIESVSMALPIAGIAVHLDIASLFAVFFKMNDSTLKIRSSFAIPLAEVEDLECLTIRCVPFRAVFPIEEPGLNFDFALSHSSFLQMICLPGGPVAETVECFHRSG